MFRSISIENNRTIQTFSKPGADRMTPVDVSGIQSCFIGGLTTIFGFSFGKFGPR